MDSKESTVNWLAATSAYLPPAQQPALVTQRQLSQKPAKVVKGHESDGEGDGRAVGAASEDLR